MTPPWPDPTPHLAATRLLAALVAGLGWSAACWLWGAWVARRWRRRADYDEGHRAGWTERGRVDAAAPTPWPGRGTQTWEGR